MSITGIQGQLLEVTVVGCSRLKDTEWISRQDPYVVLEYASNKHRTRTCKDGGKNPTFQEKFVFTLIEGLREISVVVWNSNTLSLDDFIGNGKIQLHKVLSKGYDDSSWPIQDKQGKHAGEVRLIMHYVQASKPSSTPTPSAPPYTSAHPPIMHQLPPPLAPNYPPPAYATMQPPPPPIHSYPPTSTAFHPYAQPPPPPYNHHHHQTPPVSAYPPQPIAYPPTTSDPYYSYPPPNVYPYPPPPY